MSDKQSQPNKQQGQHQPPMHGQPMYEPKKVGQNPAENRRGDQNQKDKNSEREKPTAA
jgi:hypothetical protein